MVTRRRFGQLALSTTACCAMARTAASAPSAEPAFDPVTPDRPVRAVLWSWTTAEQARELRGGAPLLSRSESPGLGPGTLFRFLEEQDTPEAKLLRSARFAKGRYAWVNPWATVSGFAGEDYGTELLRIRLKDTARLGVLSASTGRWRFVDVGNAPVDAGLALAEPEKLAGVCFVNDTFRYAGTFGGCLARGGAGDPYREVYVGNESLVESVSLRTSEIREELVRSVATLELFEAFLRTGGSPHAAGYRCAWAGEDGFAMFHPRRVAGPIARYEASLAFLDEAHFATPANVWRISRLLSGCLFEPDPWTRTPR